MSWWKACRRDVRFRRAELAPARLAHRFIHFGRRWSVTSFSTRGCRRYRGPSCRPRDQVRAGVDQVAHRLIDVYAAPRPRGPVAVVVAPVSTIRMPSLSGCSPTCTVMLLGRSRTYKRCREHGEPQCRIALGKHQRRANSGRQTSGLIWRAPWQAVSVPFLMSSCSWSNFL